MIQSLLDQYINGRKEIQIGKLLEDLDSHAAVIANLHALPHDTECGQYVHPAIVTASVDLIVLVGDLSQLRDYEIRGRTTWTGRSSMQVSLEVLTSQQTILEAIFTMVALNPVSKRYGPSKLPR
jgi:acyl-CoA hydrolase